MARELTREPVQTIVSHTGAEHRQHPRVPVFIAVGCALLDADSNPLFECMGTIKDVSQTGLGIEMPGFVHSEQVGLTFVDLANKVVEIRGKVVFSRATSTGSFRVGVRLLGGKTKIDEFVAKAVRHYHYTKNIKCVD